MAVCVGSVRNVTQSYRGMVMSYINDHKINLRGKINLSLSSQGENDNMKQVKIRNQQYIKSVNTGPLMGGSR